VAYYVINIHICQTAQTTEQTCNFCTKNRQRSHTVNPLYRVLWAGDG